MKNIVIISILVAILAVAVVGEVDTANDNQILENKELKVHGKDFVPDEIIVKVKGDREPFKVIKVPQGKVGEKIKEFKNRADVIYAEPNYYAYALMAPNDPYYNYQWHLDSINMKQAWDISTGEGTIVAVLDTGIRRGTDLALTCFVTGYDFAYNDADPIDDNGHGTHVAGTIAQSTNNGLGVAGVAFNSCLMPVKVLNSAGSGSYSSIASGIHYAVDNGADVISLSLGGPSSSDALTEAVRYAYDKGVTVVAACGNENTNTCLYPAAYDDYVIAVGATQYDETRAPYSNYGSSLDIVAPGGNTDVDLNGDGYVDGVLQQTFTISRGRINWGYYFFQGTSMATPHVSGVAALVIANGVTGPDNVRAALETTAKDKGATGWDETYGWGLVDAFAALNYVPGPIDNPPTVTITNPSDGDTVSGTIDITANPTDDVGVDWVDFYNGSTLIGTDTESPYSVSWDSTTVADGTYTFKATVTDTADHQASDSISILVDNINDLPVADAGPDQSAFVGSTLNFNGSGSSDPDGTIVSYAWDFGDGDTAIGVTTPHNYEAAGIYTVTLNVTDDDGSSDTDKATVTVNVAPSEVTVFSDSFEISEWNGLWTEDSQNKWSRSTQRAINGRYSAKVNGKASDAKLTSNGFIDLQGRTNATITFSWYIASSLDSGEYLAFDVSTNGGITWVEKARLKGNVDPENVWRDVSIDLTDITNLRIQFRGKMSDSSENAYVDMVKVTAR